ncbi:MAG: DMT family transporter [Deltaproteobacteria bacterium]|nr:DMT family transporter [Deltaproteobacteria bacterium]
MSAAPQPQQTGRHLGVGSALLAAVLFGASTPAVKTLSAGVGANAGAALLYLGSGLGLLLLLVVKMLRRQPVAPIPRGARLRFVGAIVAGGVVAPALLLIGLRVTAASTASLLLNIEGVLTAVIAWVVFRENMDRRILLGMLAIVAGGVVLSFDVTGFAFDIGALFVIAACAGWAIDNNLTQAASSADPLLVAGLKGLVAGVVNGGIALGLEQPLPAGAGAALTMAAGFCGYGLSLTFFVLGLRHLGTARTGAYFGAAPFVGALLSIVFLHEPFGWQLVVAGGLMGVGLWLHLSERHEHDHQHDELEHDHEHVHDEHHQHAHDDGVAPAERHTHRHRHAPLLHKHPHAPDLHHRHDH